MTARKKTTPKKSPPASAAEAVVARRPLAPTATAVTPAGDTFPIVGIGASAGGLAAFEAFFSALPENSGGGMAFIVVQHLAPDHKSILTELIARYTRMQV